MLIENEFIRNFSAGFSRSPDQINKLHESDAELYSFNNNLLAFTVDGLTEEIDSGLYDDPYLIGWMAVTASLSDLAAVGSSPRGLLLNVQFAGTPQGNMTRELNRGIRDACALYGTHVLGGDTNFSSSLSIACFAFGVTDKFKPLTRQGCQPGDLVYGTGPLGAGNAYALEKLIYKNSSFPYQPVARIREGQLIRYHASACIDTSDGLFPALAQLSEVNTIGFSLSNDVSNLLDLRVLSLADRRRIPPWMFLAGPHGEFELVFTIPFERNETFLNEASHKNFHPLRIGEVTVGPETSFLSEGKVRRINLDTITNLFNESGGDALKYLDSLNKIEYGK